MREWPYEAIVTVLERGLVSDWALLTREIRRDPWGPVARRVGDYLTHDRPRGLAPLLERAVASAREEAARSERAEVAPEVELVDRSGLTSSAFAERIGTSASRLSTYRSGIVTPSAAMLVRMRRPVGDHRTSS
ncbi:XRE family transcriptional regulator [Ornithinimicrobium avium]|uniref:XRE family transcriptional regulator n=1 Tax=Ornithinimicrobium avium TaxID=2283195 RepID=A0A345NRU6_9MICO|nr:XRE family transcriptional regulator [Ornithinimicrobium avium]